MSSRSWDTSARISFDKACEGKQRFTSRREARKVRTRTNSDRGGHLTIYRCPFCDFFHLGHLARAVVRGELGRDQYRGEA